MQLKEMFSEGSRSPLGSQSGKIHLHCSSGTSLHCINKQTGTHLDDIWDSEDRGGIRTSSCLTLRSSVSLFMPDLCISIKTYIVVDSLPLFSTLALLLLNLGYWAAAITPWHGFKHDRHDEAAGCYNIICLLTPIFGLVSVLLKCTTSALENNLSFVLQQAICCKGMRQSSAGKDNLCKLQQLKCIIFWHKLQYRLSERYLRSYE